MTDELKAMLKAAKTEEEAKEILLAHKNELTEEEQEKISGGEWTQSMYNMLFEILGSMDVTQLRGSNWG